MKKKLGVAILFRYSIEREKRNSSYRWHFGMWDDNIGSRFLSLGYRPRDRMEVHLICA
ncbi:unnamed protein product (mitochondrion) [Musa banksii]